MINLLIIDDEEFIVLGYTKGVDWSTIGVDNTYGFDNISDAKKILENTEIHVLLCDIEMPGQNGLSFAEWVINNYPSTKIIFLTGHSSFLYAQQALRLQSFDYLLKPVSIDLLIETVSNAIKQVNSERAHKDLFLKSSKYFDLWEKQKPLIINRFWQDLLNQKIPLSRDSTEEFFNEYELSLSYNSPIVLILVAFENIDLNRTVQERDLYKLTSQNIAEEVLLEKLNGNVLVDAYGYNIVILYNNPQFGMTELENSCQILVEEYNQKLHLSACCYIGKFTIIEKIIDSYYYLIDIKNNHITLSNTVINSNQLQPFTQKSFYPISAVEWEELFELGKKDELLSRVKNHLELLMAENASKENLEAFFYSLVNIIFKIFHNSGLSLNEALEKEEFIYKQIHISSVSQAIVWAEQIISKTVDFMDVKAINAPAVIKKIKDYIMTHVSEDFTREDVAKAVFIHPNYLSKLFKTETSNTLTEYITKFRIERAKELLCTTNNKVTAISEAVGISNGGYFAKLFRATTGITPQEYRKNHQIL